MADDNRATLEELLQSGLIRVATSDDAFSFGEPVKPKPAPDRIQLGIPLADAVWRFAREPAAGRRFLDLAWRTRIKSYSPDLLTLEDLEEYYDLRDGLCGELVEKLATGEVEAFRLLDGGTREAVVRVAWGLARAWTRSGSSQRRMARLCQGFCSGYQPRLPTHQPFQPPRPCPFHPKWDFQSKR